MSSAVRPKPSKIHTLLRKIDTDPPNAKMPPPNSASSQLFPIAGRVIFLDSAAAIRTGPLAQHVTVGFPCCNKQLWAGWRVARRPRRYRSGRQASRQCRGRRRGATSIRSNWISRRPRSGREMINASAARLMRRRCRGVTALAAAATSARDLTSIIAKTLPRRATMSISPAGQRQPRATMCQPCSRKCQRHSHSGEAPATLGALSAGGDVPTRSVHHSPARIAKARR